MPSPRTLHKTYAKRLNDSMNLLILAAGYATRLYPLTQNRAKPLLTVAGKPMVEWVLDNLRPIAAIDKVYVVTNEKFAPQFQEWADDYRRNKAAVDFTIVNDGSTDDSNKRGAIGDIHFVLETQKIDDDLIVVAGDNLFSTSLRGFGEFCGDMQAPVTAVYDVKTRELASKYNAIKLDQNRKIIHFEEKPEEPESTISGIALYYYPRPTLSMIKRYIAEGNNPDQPGRLIQWLYPRTPVYAWDVPGLWFDVGDLDSYEEANRVFAELKAE